MSLDSFLKRDQRHGTASHRRAPKQERDLATRTGGELVPGSGCSYQKGDVKKAWGIVRIEAKTTKRKSFSVTREMVAKVEDAALGNNEFPAIIIEFLTEQGTPEMEVAVIPMYALTALGEGYGET